MRVVIIGYATFMFLLSAIQLLSAGGDEEKKGKSKNRIINGVL
jgi:hypothetical protein